MTKFTIAGWLLVAIAVVGLALAIPAVSAHGPGPLAGDASADNETATDGPGWMGPNAGEHMSPASLEWMAQHMGMTVEELTRHMADGEHVGDHEQHQHQGQHQNHQHQNQHQNHQHQGQHGGMSGQGQGC